MSNKFETMSHKEKYCICEICYDKKIYEMKKKIKTNNLENNNDSNSKNNSPKKGCIHFIFNYN